MQVFKAYFKVIKKNLGSMMIYLIVFFALTVIFSLVYKDRSPDGFVVSKSDIALITEEQDSVLVNGLKTYLAQHANIIDIGKDEQSLQDALFFREVVYIVKVPGGFTESFLSGKNDVLLEKTAIPDSISGVYMDRLIERYLRMASLYSTNMPSITQQQLVDSIENDLSISTDVDLKTFDAKTVGGNLTYFTYIAYSMMAIMILGVSSILLVFNETDLHRRNLCSPLRTFSLNLQLLLGNLIFAVIVWACMMALSIAPSGSNIWTTSFALLCLNAFVLTLCCLSISFLVGNLIKSRGAQQSIANVLALGTCFISGVFVPQSMLGSTVQTIASFTPTYWYVKSINDIGNLTIIDGGTMKPIVSSMLIQLGFAIAILAVSLVIVKQKRISRA